MNLDQSFLAIIPARGGSKRLKNKNILNLAGKPTIAYSIEVALKSKYINSVVVTSDSDEILQVSKEYGANTIKRPKELAEDSTSSFDAIEHTIKSLEPYEYIVLLQPTSPLRSLNDIDKAIELLKEKKADAVISFCEVDHPVQWTTSLNSTLKLDNFIDNINTKRSQEQKKYYRLNGAIYIVRTKKLLEEKTFFLKKNSYAYIMDKRNSIDIDDEIDFLVAQTIVQNQNN